MRLPRRFIGVFYAILACVVCIVLLVLSGQNAWTQTKSLVKPESISKIPSNPSGESIEEFGTFAWETFIALNLPADCKTGEPLKGIKIGQALDKARVWEFYNFPETIFQSNNAGNPVSLENPPQCHPKQNIRIPLRLTEPAGDPDQQLKRTVLIDQSGNYILNEIHIHPNEVQQIVDNEWYSASNLTGFDNENNRFTLASSSDNDVGALEIKVAWKVLQDPVSEEVQKQYYTTRRTFEVEDVNQQKKEVTVSVGLVGFHIMHKTRTKGWVFATFEQVNNAPDEFISYTLHNPVSKHICGVNDDCATEPYLWQDEFPHAVTKTLEGQIQSQPHSQITRLIPINKDIRNLNKRWQEKLGSISAPVWRNYKLVGVQWLLKPNNASLSKRLKHRYTLLENLNTLGENSQNLLEKDGYTRRQLLKTLLETNRAELLKNLEVLENQNDLPKELNNLLNNLDAQPREGKSFSRLANVTLEPYVQKTPIGSSCIACHVFATLPEPNGSTFADFSFLLNNPQNSFNKKDVK